MGDLAACRTRMVTCVGLLSLQQAQMQSLSRMGVGAFSMPWLHPENFPELLGLFLSRVFVHQPLACPASCHVMCNVGVPGFWALVTAGAKMLLSA